MIEKKEVDEVFIKLGIDNSPKQGSSRILDDFVNAWSFCKPVGKSVNESFSVEAENLLRQIEL